MREIIITTYEAFDGEIFDNQKDCEDWEGRIESCFHTFSFYNKYGELIRVETVPEFETAYNDCIVMLIHDTPTWREDLEFARSYFGFPCEYSFTDNFIPGWYYFDQGMGWERM